MDFNDFNSWFDIIGNLWIGFVAIIVAGVPGYFSLRQHIKSIQHQVVNGHKEPLRMDLDKVINSLNDMGQKVDSISHGLHSMREELLHEESRRRTSVQELRDDFDRKLTSFMERFHNSD